MMNSARSWLALAALLATGCVVEHGGPPPPDDGTLRVDWTVDGSPDPNLCNQANAMTLDLAVYDDGGNSVGDFQTDCAAFAITVGLAPGRYSASARLLDSGNGVRTTTVDISPFVIDSNTELDVPIDFPASSFE
jgi:hypothetical protein